MTRAFTGRVKWLLLMLAAGVSPVAMATQMDGFGSHYYQDDLPITYHDTRKGLTPDVIVGDRLFVMAFSRLADLAKTAGVTVNQGQKASWLCLKSAGVNYWFISDNEMGQGSLTSVAIAREGLQRGCSSYKGSLSVMIQGIPLLSATLETLSSTFSQRPEGNIMQYCTNTQSYGEFTQTNCLQYFFEKNAVTGVFISQVTSR